MIFSPFLALFMLSGLRILLVHFLKETHHWHYPSFSIPLTVSLAIPLTIPLAHTLRIRSVLRKFFRFLQRVQTGGYSSSAFTLVFSDGGSETVLNFSFDRVLSDLWLNRFDFVEVGVWILNLIISPSPFFTLSLVALSLADFCFVAFPLFRDLWSFSLFLPREAAIVVSCAKRFATLKIAFWSTWATCFPC